MSVTKWVRVLRRVLRTFELGFAALTTGARSIPLGDNGSLLRALAARAGESGDRAGRGPKTCR
jgi:hypothetical protein